MPMGIGPELDDELVPEPEPELEPQAAMPVTSAAAARPATADAPKRLRNTIGPPVCRGGTPARTPRPSGQPLTCAARLPTRRARPGSDRTCQENRSDVLRCQRAAGAGNRTVTESIS